MRVLSILIVSILLFTLSNAAFSYGETSENIKVFRQKHSNRNNKAQANVKIKVRRLNSVTANVTGVNGSRRDYAKVKLVINNEKYFPLQNIRPLERKRTTFEIPAVLVKNSRGSLDVKCFVTNENPQSKVTLSFTARYQNSTSYNPHNPGNSYDPHHPGSGHDHYNPGHNYGLTAEDYIRRAEQEYSYQKHDEILVAGSRRLRSLKGILKLAGAANLQATVDKIAKEISSSDRRFYDMPSYREIKQEIDGIYWYSAHDNLLKAVSKKTDSVRSIMFMASLAHLNDGANSIVNSLDDLGTYSAMDVPTYEEIKKAHNDIMWYNTADNMLVKVARFVKNPRQLEKMADLANYYNSKKIIRKIIDDIYYGNNHGGYDDNYGDHHDDDYYHPTHPGDHNNHDPYDPYDPGYNNGPSNPPVNNDPVYDDYFKNAAVSSTRSRSASESTELAVSDNSENTKTEKPAEIDQELYKAFLEESSADLLEFTPQDIENRNYHNIIGFLKAFHGNKIRKNDKSNELYGKIREMLVFEAQNGSEKAEKILDHIK